VLSLCKQQDTINISNLLELREHYQALCEEYLGARQFEGETRVGARNKFTDLVAQQVHLNWLTCAGGGNAYAATFPTPSQVTQKQPIVDTLHSKSNNNGFDNANKKKLFPTTGFGVNTRNTKLDVPQCRGLPKEEAVMQLFAVKRWHHLE